MPKFPLSSHDDTRYIASLYRQIASLERRRNAAEEDIHARKRPRNLFLAFFVPMFRRSLAIDVHRLRREISQMDNKLLDVRAELEALEGE